MVLWVLLQKEHYANPKFTLFNRKIFQLFKKLACLICLYKFPTPDTQGENSVQCLCRIMMPMAELSHPASAQGPTECAGFCSNRASNYLS